MSAQTEPLPQDAFPSQTVMTLRYCDHDGAGHVNNAIYATMFEAGRVPLLYDPGRGVPPPDCHFSLVRITIDFLREMTWPGDVTIGTGVTRIGNSSLSFRQSVFKDGERCAQADSTVVLTGSTTRKSQPLPDEVRSRFEELLLTQE